MRVIEITINMHNANVNLNETRNGTWNVECDIHRKDKDLKVVNEAQPD